MIDRLTDTADIDNFPAPPRRVRRRRGHGWLLSFENFVILPFTVFGIYWLFGAIHVTVGAIFGPVTSGVITSTYTRQVKDAIEDHVTYRYYVDGVEHDDDSSVDWFDFNAVKPGTVIELILAPEGPTDQTLIISPIHSGIKALGYTWLFAIFWMCAMSSMWWRFVIHPLLIRQLIMTGQPCPGVVTNKDIDHGNQKQYRVHYEYRPTSGPPINGMTIVHSSVYDTVKVGLSTIVLFDPNRPKFSVAYSLADYEIC